MRLHFLIDKLSSLDPVFSDWHAGATPIDAGALTELFDGSRTYYDYPPDKVMSEVGFLLSIWSYKQELDHPILSIHAGSYGEWNRDGNSIEMHLTNRRALTGEPWKASELRPVLLAVVDAWGADEASIDCKSYSSFRRFLDLGPRHHPRLYSPWEGWITYLPPANARLVTAPDGVQVEQLNNGGALYTLCDEPFTTGNPRHMELAAAMQRALTPIQTA
jgi:hypothetical protein